MAQFGDPFEDDQAPLVDPVEGDEGVAGDSSDADSNFGDDNEEFELDDDVGCGSSGPPPLRYDYASSVIGGGVPPLQSLPSRHDFIVATEENRKLHLQTLTKVQAGKPVLFLPNDIAESINYVRPSGARWGASAVQRYRLDIFGVLPDGSKAHVVLDDVPVYFDIWFPDVGCASNAAPASNARTGETAGAPEDTGRFSYLINGLLQEFGLERTEVGEAFPLRGWRPAPRKYLRAFFTNLASRKKAIISIRKQGYETASDDLSNYFRMVARTHSLPLCGWLTVAGYSYERGGAACNCVQSHAGRCPGATSPRSPLASHVLNAPIAGLKALVNPLDPDPDIEKKVQASPALSRDRSLVMTFDIETHSPDKGLGTPPNASKPNDVVFMLCASAHWRNDPKPLARVCLVTQETAPDARWATVVCGPGGSPSSARPNMTAGQDSLLMAYAMLYRAWAPELHTGFNDGQYDWPFLVEKGRQFGLLASMDSLMNALPRKTTTDESVLRWQYKMDQKVKINAEKRHAVSYLKMPGCVPIDTRVAYMRLYPKAEKSSLKYFLNRVGLGGKADMPYTRMWKIYERSLDVADTAGASNADARATSAEEMRQVAHYCVVDALRCQELLVRRNVVGDSREVGNYSFTCLNDCVFYAGGHKVCNMLMAYGQASKALLGYPILGSMIAEKVEIEGKYPGAYVVPPEKGLEEDDPITGLDFASLYPSLIRTYNLSLDRALYSEEEAVRLEQECQQVHRVEFEFGAQVVKGWFNRHQNKDSERGIFARVLADLFSKRAKMKVLVKLYEAQIEYAEAAIGAFRRSTPTGSKGFGAHLEKTASETEKEAKAYEASAKEAAADGKHRTAASNKKKAKAATVRAKELRAALSEISEAAQQAPCDAVILAKFEDRLADLKFKFAGIDAKQKAVKVFMNTFYGEAGNKNSPIFMLELAGGVTSAGRYNLHLVAEFVKSKGFRIKYGDTDSLYVACPRWSYAEVEAVYRKALAAAFGQPEEAATESYLEFEARQGTARRALAQAEAKYAQQLAAIAQAESGAPGVVPADVPGLAKARARADELVAAARAAPQPVYLAPYDEAEKDSWLRNRFNALGRRAGQERQAAAEKTVYDAYEQLCVEKIDITMDVMSVLRDEVNAHLAQDNGTDILKMAYEEVLHPVVFTGKKKYFGVAHVNAPNYNISGPEKIFVRGIDIVKQGQTRLTRELGLRCMWAATRLHPPGDRVPLIERVQNVLRDGCSSMGTFRANELGTGSWKLEDFIQTDAWKPEKDNKSVQKFMRRMRARHRLQVAENEARAQQGKNLRPLDYIEPEAGSRFSYLIIDPGPCFDLQGFAEASTSKGALMEYEHVARKKNLRINVAYYLAHYVVGLCARFINYDDRFQMQTPGARSVDPKELDKHAQKEAKKFLTKFVNSLNTSNRSVSQKRGYAYKRAYKSAASKARNILNQQLGATAGLFTGWGDADLVLSKGDLGQAPSDRAASGIINFELFLPSDSYDACCPAPSAGGGLVPIPFAERLRGAAAKFAEFACSQFEIPLPRWNCHAENGNGALSNTAPRSAVDHAVQALGIDKTPEGRKRLYEHIALIQPPSRRSLYRSGIRGDPLVLMQKQAWNRVEQDAYVALEEISPVVGAIAERVQTSIEELVATERRREHRLHPQELGALEEDEGFVSSDGLDTTALVDAKIADDFRCSESETAALQTAQNAWLQLVSVAFLRQSQQRLLEKLCLIRDRAL